MHPSIVHSVNKRQKRFKLNNTEVHHISHRGGAGERLENTMEAFDHSAEIGTDMFEIDCLLTKDGHPVVVHDNNLSRLCGEDVCVTDTNFEDLPPLSCSQRLDFNHQFVITKNIPEQKRRIILLEDLFAKYPGMPMNIDLKAMDRQLIDAVALLVAKYKRESFTIWGNSSDTTTRNVRLANRSVMTLYSKSEVLKTIAFYYLGLLPFAPVYADFLEIPLLYSLLEHPQTFPSIAKSWFLTNVVHLFDYLLTNRTLIDHLRKRGVRTYFFVLNTEREWKRAIDCGAAGIMTDFPTELKLWLDKQCNGI